METILLYKRFKHTAHNGDIVGSSRNVHVVYRIKVINITLELIYNDV